MKTKKVRLDIMISPKYKEILREKARIQECSISQYVEYLVYKDYNNTMRIHRIEKKIDDIWNWCHPLRDEDIPF